MELPPLVLGTILNREQSQEVLKKGLLPFGTCVLHESAGHRQNYTILGAISKAISSEHIRDGFISVVHCDVKRPSKGSSWQSVDRLEIYPPLTPEAYKQLELQRRVAYGLI